ncbi:MAG: hypothetical protein WDN44_11430 [Sphingomonas sp.]
MKGADGQYATAQTASMNPTSGQIDLLCIITDDDGVKSASVSYSGASPSCVYGDSFDNGSFSVEGLPKDLSQTLQGDEGKVITKLPILATLKGPLSCKSFGFPKKTGVPGNGAKVTVSCGGTNWSSDPAKNGVATSLAVTLQ